jgi:hypothetical protein
MHLRDVGPGIGGLNYGPLLRHRNEKAMRRALSRLPQEGETKLARPGGLWQSILVTMRNMGRRLIAARMAEAERLVELETARYRGHDGLRSGRGAIGSRYY